MLVEAVDNGCEEDGRIDCRLAQHKGKPSYLNVRDMNIS
jgi:hypothetical protein